MKRIICKVEYDTEASTLVAKHTVGEFGDPTGYEESLYVTEGGKYFLYPRAVMSLNRLRLRNYAQPSTPRP